LGGATDMDNGRGKRLVSENF